MFGYSSYSIAVTTVGRLIASILVVIAGISTRAIAAEDRPNIILIIADDMAADDFGAGGNKAVRTPNLDRLAAQGLQFQRAFLTCSSCSPSRSSIITSRYPHSTDAEQLHWPLPAEQVTFVEQLKHSGYYTAASGKWHLGNPIKKRFDFVDEAGTAAFQLPTDAAAGAKAMHDDQNASGCAGWVRVLQERPRDRPFFLWLAAFDPHRDYEPGAAEPPHRPEDVVVPPYFPDTPEVRKDLAMYYDEIARLDSYVGAVLAELDKQQIAENTMVLFMSDNGRPFPRCKTTVYDSGIRTPLIVRWPKKIQPGRTTKSLVSSIDIGPTILAAAGVETHPRFFGRSFLSVLSDPSQKHRDFIFAEHNWHDFDALERCVRGPQFKYIRNWHPEVPLTPPADAVRSPTFQAMRKLRDEGQLNAAQRRLFDAPQASEQLYDLQADPFELNNLAGRAEYQETLREYRARLDQWQKETDDSEMLRSPDEFDRETGQALKNRARPRPDKASLRAARAASSGK
ncbi:MAG: sulfatase [Pirellulales bacterium]